MTFSKLIVGFIGLAMLIYGLIKLFTLRGKEPKKNLKVIHQDPEAIAKYHRDKNIATFCGLCGAFITLYEVMILFHF